MGLFSRYINRGVRSAEKLDKSITGRYSSERNTDMVLNSKKIRRSVTIDGKQKWITADTEQEYAEKLLEMTSTKPKRIKTLSFQNYAENWFSVFCEPNVATVTSINYHRLLVNCVYPIIGPTDMSLIGPMRIQEVFNSLGKTSSQETKNKIRNVLNQIFKMAEEDRIIDRNPMQSARLKIKGTASVETEPYTIEEMRYMAARVDDIVKSSDRCWLALSLSLPLRPEEVLGLRWKDIDVEYGIVRIRSTVTHPTRNEPEFKEYTKTQASVRDLAIPQWVIDCFPQNRPDYAFVVGGENPLSYMAVRNMRKRIAKQIGFEGTITPRRFRTTVATDISDMTHDLKLVQKMLGHSTPQMTLKHYDKGRKTSTDARDAIERCYRSSD